VTADPATATRYNVQDVPTVVVRRGHAATTGASAESPANVRFVGLPSGYEFSTLVADVIDVSTGRTDLAAVTREAARAIDRPVHVQVFVTQT
jgi:alkyl hydroperoxide reductase subunit AhpF